MLLAVGLALSGGQAFARGNSKQKKGSSSAASSAGNTQPAGARKHPTEVHLNSDVPDPAAASGGNATANAGAPPQRGPTRIDFDDRLIQGQTNKSGAVYLYDRKELKTRSMIKMRDSFREETVGSVYDG